GPENDDFLARIPVGKRASKGRGDHVETQKGAGQVTDLGVGEMKFTLHQRLHGKQNRAVDIVQQVQRGEKNERGAGIEFGFAHLPKEYSTPPPLALRITESISLPFFLAASARRSP